MAKVTFIKLQEPGSAAIRGVGKSQNREFRIGYPCSPDFGGGRIVSMEIDRGMQAVVIKKEAPFAGPPDTAGKREEFDAACVALSALASWTIVEDKPEPQISTSGSTDTWNVNSSTQTEQDPPPARPIQKPQQGQGQQQKGK